MYNSGKKKGTLYLGRVTKRFLSEKDGPVDELELDCLKPALGPSTTILEEPPNHLGKDLGMFKAYDIIAAPRELTYCEGQKWKFENYGRLHRYFEILERSKLKRINMFQRANGGIK